MRRKMTQLKIDGNTAQTDTAKKDDTAKADDTKKADTAKTDTAKTADSKANATNLPKQMILHHLQCLHLVQLDGYWCVLRI